MITELSHRRNIGGVDVFSWNRATPGNDGGRLLNNFGDLLASYLVERLTPPAVSPAPAVDPDRPALFTVGSVLHFVTGPSVVWGTGINFKVPAPLPKALDRVDVRAVRGPLTARTLAAMGIRVPAVFGDPGLLTPRLHPELRGWTARKRHSVLAVPNLNDLPAQAGEATRLGVAFLDPTSPLDHVLHEIAQSEFVIGSSLHAIVIADALGIPARFVASAAEHPFKYRDYLAGSGRPDTRIAEDLAAAITLGGHRAPEVDLDRLLDAFPHDLWTATPPPSLAPDFCPAPQLANAWQRVIARTPPSADTEISELVSHRLPRLTELADRVLQAAGEVSLDSDGPEVLAYLAAFTDESAHYRGLLRDLGPTDPEIDEGLACLAADRPDMFLRWRWLHRTGPHAVLQRSQLGNGICASISLRPGQLTNNIERVLIRFTAADGRVVTAPAPVFAMNSLQWSVDVTVALPEESLRGAVWHVDALLNDADLLTVLDPAEPGLFGFPDWITDPPLPWELRLAAAVGEEG